jgi:hypothetical protein
MEPCAACAIRWCNGMTAELFEAVKDRDWLLAARNYRAWYEGIWEFDRAGRFIERDPVLNATWPTYIDYDADKLAETEARLTPRRVQRNDVVRAGV